MLRLISSRPNSSFNIFWCPCSAARSSGVWPYSVSAVLGSISSRFNSNFTTPSCPFSTAEKSGVRPYLVSAALTSISCRYNTKFTAPSSPRSAARKSCVGSDSVSEYGGGSMVCPQNVECAYAIATTTGAILVVLWKSSC